MAGEEPRAQRKMEGGKSVEEAGPSWACSGAVENQNPEKLKDRTEKLCTFSDVEERNGEYGGKDVGDGGAVGGDGAFVPGPLLSLKEQIDKDKDDESLRRWKEKLLGCLESDLNGQMEPEVKFHSIGIVSDDFAEITTALPTKDDEGDCVLFTLQEGCQYRLKLTFSVLHNIVSGLTYSNRVWKAGIQVDRSGGMLGTFAPRREPYVHTLDEETTPSGVLARGIYSAKLKFEDDDRRCHMELEYSFEIKKSV